MSSNRLRTKTWDRGIRYKPVRRLRDSYFGAGVPLCVASKAWISFFLFFSCVCLSLSLSPSSPFFSFSFSLLLARTRMNGESSRLFNELPLSLSVNYELFNDSWLTKMADRSIVNRWSRWCDAWMTDRLEIRLTLNVVANCGLDAVVPFVFDVGTRQVSLFILAFTCHMTGNIVTRYCTEMNISFS